MFSRAHAILTCPEGASLGSLTVLTFELERTVRDKFRHAVDLMSVCIIREGRTACENRGSV